MELYPYSSYIPALYEGDKITLVVSAFEWNSACTFTKSSFYKGFDNENVQLKYISHTNWPYGKITSPNRISNYFFFFFFNRLCNPCGFWPAQLSLSILSRKVFTDCRCQRHVKPPNWRTSDYNVPTPTTRHLHVWNKASEPQQWKVELWARNCREFCPNWRLPRHFWVLLHAVNYDMGPSALLPLTRKECWRFICPKNSSAWAGFESANLGTEASTLTSRTPKSLISNHYRAECINNSSHHQDTQTAAKTFIVSVKLYSHLQLSVYTNTIISQIIK